MRQIEFAALDTADLIIDAIYKGGTSKNILADPLQKLLPVGNAGGFRYKVGRIGGVKNVCVLVALFSTENEPNWPDHLDPETGRFTYYGDNRSPGHGLHETPRGGNSLLRRMFEQLHDREQQYLGIPPFFIFTSTGVGRDIRFRGLAAPGAPSVSAADDLVAVWKTVKGSRFQNYRATFTVLDVACVPRAWINDLISGSALSPNAPPQWVQFIDKRVYRPLTAPRVLRHRTPAEQKPETDAGLEIIRLIHKHFDGRPYDFEKCAVEIARMMDANIIDCDLTRPWLDGGRDALGFYRIGPPSDPVKVEFALEAKCYKLENGNGVEHTSRLISRLRHRQFGIFVTTSFLDDQAYKEVREDNHPVVILSSADIVRILTSKGYSTTKDVQHWLSALFP